MKIITKKKYPKLWWFLEFMRLNDGGEAPGRSVRVKEKWDLEKLEQQAGRLSEGRCDLSDFSPELQALLREDPPTERELFAIAVDDSSPVLAAKYDIHLLETFLGDFFEGDQ